MSNEAIITAVEAMASTAETEGTQVTISPEWLRLLITANVPSNAETLNAATLKDLEEQVESLQVQLSSARERAKQLDEALDEQRYTTGAANTRAAQADLARVAAEDRQRELQTAIDNAAARISELEKQSNDAALLNIKMAAIVNNTCRDAEERGARHMLLAAIGSYRKHEPNGTHYESRLPEWLAKLDPRTVINSVRSPIVEPVADEGDTSSLDTALATFKSQWLLLPALARAAVGAGYAKYLAQAALREGDDSAHVFDKLGLTRRAAVARACQIGGLLIADLLVGVTRHADNQVTDAGLPEDIVPGKEWHVSLDQLGNP